ncbi:xanthine dehydrogenase family protein molybdopterin-binding subunit [Pseudonocardia sp. H11422]|uniref:xanthine dehydrogenase family protein molybdopterin-binding subunit n=1 Tax=Pseudonocardia sp. H11422 TaxID=2835866 RepID=UPI0027E23973|nr:xanthine dehydrogenase family protein molybdopterin-binding subunit [Pseudonocardia sp. H11422]
MSAPPRAVGAGATRLEGRLKVTGEARYAAEYPVPGLAVGAVVTSTIARGRITDMDTAAVLAMPGVIGVLNHGNAPRLADAGQGNLMVLQDDRVPYRGAVVALVVAETSEQARAGADALRVRYAEEPHDVVLTADHPRLYTPDHVNPALPTDSVTGDVEAGLARADVVVDAVYSTPTEQNNPMEPHSSTAWWADGRLTVIDSNQGSWVVRDTLATLFALDPDAVRVVSEHVGGGFGAKGRPRPQVVLAPMAARQLDRPVRVTLTRQQMFALVGYRTPTIQRVRLGADREGRLTALDHLACEQTSTVVEFAEQTAVFSRVMYATPNLRTRHRLVALDVPSPHWMRAPGEAPGSFAVESALDELAQACGIDPVELRVRNEPAVEPDRGLPFVSRNLVPCLREGAARFGWSARDPRPGVRRDGRLLRGTGVAAATYPARSTPSTASVTAEPDGRYTVRITASDIGTGARTALTQIAADELGVPLEDVRVLIGDSDFGPAQGAGGSLGTASWGWAIVKAARELRDRLAGAGVPAGGLTVRADTTEDIRALPDVVRHAFGAHFAEVVVDPASGEVRVPRLLGVYGVGRVVNPVTARSQLIGAMTMGLGMALLEEAVVDPQFGDYANHDLAGYHVPVNADVRSVEAHWVDERNDGLNPTGVKGLGEIGIVGTAAAIANAVWHATGVRHRDLPIRPDRVLAGGDR